MTPSPRNTAVFATAGSAKTQQVIDQALAADGRVLIVTYTNWNLQQLRLRLAEAGGGCVPPNIKIMSWFSFLLHDVCRPYQRAFTGSPDYIRSVNFVSEFPKFNSKDNLVKRYIDRGGNLYADGVSDFGSKLDDATNGLVIQRLEGMYDVMLVDEVQDLVGYDLEILLKLFKSAIEVVVVGDPRQFLYSTNRSQKNKQFRGPAIVGWFEKHPSLVKIETRAESYRCGEAICEFASALFPELPAMTSNSDAEAEREGIEVIGLSDVDSYVEEFSPTVLRPSVATATGGLRAMNIGAAKGCTYDRVLIFPTQTMLAYVRTGDLAKFKDRSRLYVAATRARFSVVFVDAGK